MLHTVEFVSRLRFLVVAVQSVSRSGYTMFAPIACVLNIHLCAVPSILFHFPFQPANRSFAEGIVIVAFGRNDGNGTFEEYRLTKVISGRIYCLHHFRISSAAYSSLLLFYR